MSAEESQVVGTVTLAGVDGYSFSGDTYTVERKCAFIHLYREHGSVFHAAKLTPVSRKTVYNWMAQDEEFAEAVADSREDSLDDLETSVYKRAFNDSLLAMFYLKAHRPKFRDKVSIDLDSLKEEIQKRIAELGSTHRQLPVTTTQFIDIAQSKQQEPQPVESHESLQFPAPPPLSQKDE